MRIGAWLPLCFLVAACSDSNTVSSDEQAKRAYLGLDKSVQKGLAEGFAGFNAANSANIPTQTMPGDVTGMIVVTGQVDQGTSANKGMRLITTLTSYSDGKFVVDSNNTMITVTYDTTQQATQPALNLTLRGIPTGTLTGTLMGTYNMTGDIKGTVTLNLSFSGMLMAGPNNTVLRAPGTTAVTGTAVSGDGMFMVNVMI